MEYNKENVQKFVDEFTESIALDLGVKRETITIIPRPRYENIEVIVDLKGRCINLEPLVFNKKHLICNMNFKLQCTDVIIFSDAQDVCMKIFYKKAIKENEKTNG